MSSLEGRQSGGGFSYVERCSLVLQTVDSLQIASQCPGHLLTPAEAPGTRRFKIYEHDVGFFKGHAFKNKIYGGSHYHREKEAFKVRLIFTDVQKKEKSQSFKGLFYYLNKENGICNNQA